MALIWVLDDYAINASEVQSLHLGESTEWLMADNISSTRLTVDITFKNKTGYTKVFTSKEERDIFVRLIEKNLN